jgi:hypothetical protein
MFRPESVSQGTAPPGANTFDALIANLQLTGATLEVDLRCNDEAYHATLLSRYALPLEAGRTCAWHVAPEDTVVIKRGKDDV